MTAPAVYAGLDFGTESVRAVLVDGTGRLRGSAIGPYAHGQIVRGSPAAASLFDHELDARAALQHPGDWLDAAAIAMQGARREAGDVRVEGVGIDATSCTVLPTSGDGTPLALADPALGAHPHAWPKLWKHHGAAAQTERMIGLARARDEPWLARYGSTIGLEWLFPKVLEVIDDDPEVAEKADVWIEAGDWIVWQLTGAPSAGGDRGPGALARSTCQAGYKALWARDTGYASQGYLDACHPELGGVARTKLPGMLRAPGEAAGGACGTAAEQLGLDAGTPVATAIIDAHAAVPGVGVGEPGVLVLVLGTSGCHMIMDPEPRPIPGVAGIVADGILPGSYGYETGQAAVGDAFAWVRRLCGAPAFAALEEQAAAVAPGADGLVAVEWLNGCRTPLMDGRRTAALTGLDLHHGAAHLYRAVMEASASGLRWIVDTLREGGVAVDRFVATGGIAESSPLYLHIVASMLDTPVEVARPPRGPAFGAAVLGAVAAGAFDRVGAAVDTMAGARSVLDAYDVVAPDRAARDSYDTLYHRYRALADQLATEVAHPTEHDRRTP